MGTLGVVGLAGTNSIHSNFLQPAILAMAAIVTAMTKSFDEVIIVVVDGVSCFFLGVQLTLYFLQGTFLR